MFFGILSSEYVFLFLRINYIQVKTVDNLYNNLLYIRVSTCNQKDDLKNQVEFLKQYANAK